MMENNRKSVRLRLEIRVFLVFLVFSGFGLCWSSNDEGRFLLRLKKGVVNDPFGALSDWRDDDKVVHPCAWFGVGCSDGKVVSLNGVQNKAPVHRKLLVPFYNPYTKLIGNKSPSADPPPTAASPKPRSIPGKTLEGTVPNKKSPSLLNPPSMPGRTPAPDISAPPPLSVSSGSLNPQQSKSSSKKHIAIVAGCIGGVVALLLSAAAVFFFRKNAGKPVNPWRTGLSGQLQKALVTGVPKLKRSELESACEDFSNVIGSCPSGTLYKGTLSSGVEIAVGSVAATSSKEWSESLEMQFWKKVEKLSKVNHKNFDNLLGYCVEEEPFTRMMVFEYAPNGTLFEHLHFKESEHLDWGMRLRVAMGLAYCLDYMHQLNPPIYHDHLTSSSIHLTEDYASKVADFSFWYNTVTPETECSSKKLINTYVHVATVENNVYSFGVLLFEMMTGRLPYTAGITESVENWASDYLGGGGEGEGKTLTEIADPSLESLDAEKMEQIEELIKTCVQTDPDQRPAMREVARRLREITGISPDGAIPRLSPLWWAELEVLSTA